MSSRIDDTDTRPIGFYAAGDVIEQVRRGPDDAGAVHTRIESCPARRVSLRSIDAGFDARALGMTISLPDREHVIVETDDHTYCGWYREVARQMTRDGWTVTSCDE